MKHTLFGFGMVGLWLAASGGVGADWISDLHSPDMQVRRDAIGAIQTMDDPRIPALCLPLLDDPGLSIRRLAARAIGSRFDEIAEADRPRYLAALAACLEKRKGEAAAGARYGDIDDISLMCQRAIGLLSRRYDSPPFSVSPDGKWVLYERRRRPVIANIAEQRHYLLTPLDPTGEGPNDAYDTKPGNPEPVPETNILKTVETNLPAEQLFAPHWRADGKGVALTLERLERRFYHPILVWSAGAPSQVVVLDESFFQSVLGTRYPQWGTTTDFVAWNGDQLLVRVYNCDYPDGEHAPDPGLIVSYDIGTKEIAVEEDLAQVCPLDAERAWAAVTVKDRVRLEYTSNGGREWRERAGPEAMEAVNLCFLDEKEGFVMTSRGSLGNHDEKVYHTTDAGLHWEAVGSPAKEGTSYYATGISFRNPQEGWITATYHGAPEVPLFHTSDGGKSWQAQALEIPADDQGGYADTYPPVFIGAGKRHGYLPVHLVRHTPEPGHEAWVNEESEDGGATWHLPAGGVQSVNEGK